MSTEQDLSFMNTEGQENAMDPAYEELMKRANEIPEAEETVGREPLPRSDYHVGKVVRIEHRTLPFDPPVEAAKVTIQAVGGSVPDAVGRFYSDDVRLEVGTQTRDGKDAPLRDKTPKELRKHENAFIGQMQRIQRVLGTASLLPMNKTPEAIAAWGETAVSKAQLGQLVIFTGYADKNGYSRIVFSSIRAPEDPAKDYRKKGKPVIPGKTALDLAYEENRKVAEREGRPFVVGDAGGNGGAETSNDF